MSAYEVTQAEYKKVMKKNPSRFSEKNIPVETVSWLDAVKYCNARSKKEELTPVYKISGKKVTWNRKANGYRLPTEAEWEYACGNPIQYGKLHQCKGGKLLWALSV